MQIVFRLLEYFVIGVIIALIVAAFFFYPMTSLAFVGATGFIATFANYRKRKSFNKTYGYSKRRELRRNYWDFYTE